MGEGPVMATVLNWLSPFLNLGPGPKAR
jgi:hypothetical protein